VTGDTTGDGEFSEFEERVGLTLDPARPDAVEKRHSSGGRTARENLDDLIDPGSFVEYGRFAIASQRSRRELDDLIRKTPADGLVAGTARVNGDLFGEEGSACAVLSYDYTVLAGTQGHLGHRKKDRLFDLIERMNLPTVFFAEGGGGRPGDTEDRGGPRPVLRRQRRDRRLLGPDRGHGVVLDRYGGTGDDQRRWAR
jgi:acetyl-CoA carboxylase carboxyltransferase component